MPLPGGLLSEGQSGYQRRELIDERFEKSSRILIGDYPVRIHQAGLKGDVGLPTHHKDTQNSENLSQVQLSHGRSDCTGRCSGNGRRLSAPRVLTIGSGAPVDRVLEQSGNRAIVSGVTNNNASAAAISDLKRTTLFGNSSSRSWLYRGRSPIETKLNANLSAPSRARACASLPLMEPRRLLPTMTAILTFAIRGLPWLSFDTKAT